MSDNENTIHNDIEPEIHEDAKSTSSSVSATHAVKKCSFCDKELQLRVMFNHIRKKHPYEFMMSMSLFDEAEIKDTITCGAAFPFSFDLMNDFDEAEEVKIFGCLACNNTFTHQSRANGHCSKDKCKKKHIAGIKSLIKQNEDDKKKAKAKAKAKKEKVKSIDELSESLILWQRRYLHLIDICTQVNQDYEHLKVQESINVQPGREIQFTVYDPIDYKIPPNCSHEMLNKAETMWAKRCFDLETRFDKLRDYLGEYSIFGMNKYYCITSDHPHRLFVGLNGHDYLGEDKYPQLP
jgi:hypothetical protein